MGLVYFVMSSQCHSCAKQAQTERDSLPFFFIEYLICTLSLDVTKKGTQKMADLCTEYPFQQSLPRVSEKKVKNGLILQSISHCMFMLVSWANKALG